MADRESARIVARIGDGVSAIARAQWDALAGGNPFVGHDFLGLLEASGSVGPGSGWTPAPLTIERDGALIGALPAYLKQHSQGEYVFDQGWADAYQRAGGAYYPKLQIAAPFSPVSGPRVLARDEDTGLQLLRAAEVLVTQNGLSSAHATFIDPDQVALFDRAGWLAREDVQFHWVNRGYADFDDFLAALSSRKRKAIRKERAAAQAAVTIEHVTGSDLGEAHWDIFWQFYQDTGARKWGTPYLTREAFSLMGETMADRLLLILARIDGDPVAGALNVVGPDRLYGRYWGCTRDIPFLHFELCYYQAIEAGIALGSTVVEAGAQGAHKLARGYEPVTTHSAHYIADPGFRAAVADFLERERAGIAAEVRILSAHAPFRQP